MKFTCSDAAKLVLIGLCVLGALACFAYFGESAVVSLLRGEGIGDSAVNALLVGCVGAIFFLWMIVNLVKVFSTQIAEDGVSGIVLCKTFRDVMRGRVYERRNISWHEVVDVIAKGHELIIVGADTKLVVNLLAFPEPKLVAAYVDEKCGQ